jgi:hypothetical protein
MAMKNKFSQSLKLLLTSLAVMSAILSIAQEETRNEPTILSIQEAIEKDFLELKISGASDSRIYHEVVDRDGVHFGKCMAIVLMSKIDSLVLLRLDCGTELIPFDSTFQTMIVTKSVDLPLYPNQTYATRFYAMCGQIHDAPPYFQSTYMVGELSDSNTVKLATYLQDNYIQNMIGQHALWAYTDEADYKELEKYGADSMSVEMTNDILNAISIRTTLNDQVSNEPPEQNTIAVNKLLVYGAGGFILLLLITTVYFFNQRNRNAEA